jgi:hypothetical protein
MNIYEKLNAARLQIAEKGLSKTGNNTFAGFKYFELSEILPVVTKVNADLKIFSAFSFLRDTATLEIVNTEKPEEKVTFSFAYSPDGAKLKACHQIQNEGAVQTYIKRYLYQNAYEIAEADQLDASVGRDEPKQGKQAKQAQAEAPKAPKKSFSDTIAEIAKDNKDAVEKALEKSGFKKVEDITDRQKQVTFYSDLMNIIHKQNTNN